MFTNVMMTQPLTPEMPYFIFKSVRQIRLREEAVSRACRSASKSPSMKTQLVHVISLWRHKITSIVCRTQSSAYIYIYDNFKCCCSPYTNTATYSHEVFSGLPVPSNYSYIWVILTTQYISPPHTHTCSC